MTCCELMIGDWVNFLIDIEGGDTDYDPKVAQYQSMKIVSLSSWYNNDGEVESAEGVINDIDQVKPIPLTPEILEKNGFDVSDKEVMQYHFEEDGEKYHFSLRQMYDKDGKPHGYSFYAFNVLTLLDYVHELQHALRLCGINKEIEL